jgi:3D (Asp-Asp-Asp) domain-containing protein
MITFKKYFITEVASTGKKFTSGATAYGNADIDATTKQEIEKGILKPDWQFLGNKNNRLTPGYSVANNRLPHGTIVRIVDKRTGQPVGAEIGNAQGIYKVEDTGGKYVSNNIDFYSGSNKQMYDYFANIGKNTNNLEVEVLNIQPGSEEEKQILANLSNPTNAAPSSETPPPEEPSYYASPSDAASGLVKGLGILGSAMGGGIK